MNYAQTAYKIMYDCTKPANQSHFHLEQRPLKRVLERFKQNLLAENVDLDIIESETQILKELIRFGKAPC